MEVPPAEPSPEGEAERAGALSPWAAGYPYVTTSFFSSQTQREVIEDRYPIVLINGKRVGEEVNKMTVEAGGVSLKTFLDELEEEHDHLSTIADPKGLLTIG